MNQRSASHRPHRQDRGEGLSVANLLSPLPPPIFPLNPLPRHEDIRPGNWIWEGTGV